jgi:hypothetical protein
MKTKYESGSNPDRLIDEALEETFPASDPISPAVGSGQPVANVSNIHSSPASAKPRRAPWEPDHRMVTLDANAVWDARYGVFQIRINDSPEFASVVVLDTAPLPLKHLSRREGTGKSLLGDALHDRLQYEVNGAIARGAHQVATGVMLMTHQEMKTLT